jgi:outer membrane receptor protein involved in Fe transport
MMTLLGNSLGDIYDIMQRGRDQVDVSYTQRINKWLQIKAGVQNLLNTKFQQYQDVKRNYKYDPEIDDNYRSFKTGAYYSIGFNFIL